MALESRAANHPGTLVGVALKTTPPNPPFHSAAEKDPVHGCAPDNLAVLPSGAASEAGVPPRRTARFDVALIFIAGEQRVHGMPSGRTRRGVLQRQAPCPGFCLTSSIDLARRCGMFEQVRPLRGDKLAHGWSARA